MKCNRFCFNGYFIPNNNTIVPDNENYNVISWGQEKSGGDINLNNTSSNNIEWNENILIKSETYNVGEKISLNVTDSSNNNVSSTITTIS